MATHRRLGQRRDDLRADGLRRCAFFERNQSPPITDPECYKVLAPCFHAVVLPVVRAKCKKRLADNYVSEVKLVILLFEVASTLVPF
jgi:hypothetical protein